MKDGLHGRLNATVRFLRYRYRIFFLAGVALTGTVLNALIFYLPLTIRLALGVVFLTFATGMLFAVTQFFSEMAFSIFSVFNRKYKVERTRDPDADSIAARIGAPLPRSINISDNPRIGAATNAWTRVITISRKVFEDLTREQLLAVITHEIAHYKYRKRFILELILAMSATMVLSLLTMSTIIAVSPVIGGFGEVSILLLMLVIVLHRNELRADNETRKVNLHSSLAEALEYFGRAGGYDEPSETHPSISSRVRRLLAPASSGLPTEWIGKLFDRNWTVNTTSSGRYRDTGTTYHIVDYAKRTQRRTLTVVDVGSSLGVAAKGMKADLAELGIGTDVTGVDISRKVQKAASLNLDKFVLGDILKIRVNDLPLADVVICNFVALWVGPNRRYQVIRRCAEQLKEEGLLDTNAFPFPDVRYLSMTDLTMYRLRSMHALYNGWKAFRSELANRREALSVTQSVSIRGRVAALAYAESILQSWSDLSTLRKALWYMEVFLYSPSSVTVGLLKAAFAQITQ